jgi:hypothetical protein
MRRDGKQDIGEHFAQAVVALPDVAQLVDQVEEGEQGDEPRQHEQHGAVDLAGEVAVEGRAPVHAISRAAA